MQNITKYELKQREYCHSSDHDAINDNLISEDDDYGNNDETMII